MAAFTKNIDYPIRLSWDDVYAVLSVYFSQEESDREVEYNILIKKVFSEGLSGSLVLLLYIEEINQFRVFKIGPQNEISQEYKNSIVFLEKIGNHSPYIVPIKQSFVTANGLGGFGMAFSEDYHDAKFLPLAKHVNLLLSEQLKSSGIIDTSSFLQKVQDLISLMRKVFYDPLKLSSSNQNYFYFKKFPDAEFDGLKVTANLSELDANSQVDLEHVSEKLDKIGFDEVPQDIAYFSLSRPLKLLSQRETYFYLVDINRSRVLKLHKCVVCNRELVIKLREHGVEESLLSTIEEHFSDSLHRLSEILAFVMEFYPDQKDQFKYWRFRSILFSSIWKEEFEEEQELYFTGKLTQTGQRKYFEYFQLDGAVRESIENLFLARKMNKTAITNIHGDFHDQNIQFSKRGIPFIIDIAKAEQNGPVWFDFAKLELSLWTTIITFFDKQSPE
ncbi:MAG: hypothetical protein KDE33_20555, partial [Bacteroidetes bacterium]|nr:hypothetical protein [Bacteroidota bacterium]